jgi:tetrahydromethanopterin S-methyltransferase subunit G
MARQGWDEYELALELNQIKSHYPSGMNGETTENIPGTRSFEERILARLDSIDSRLQFLEEQSERRALETKPIRERALAKILELRESVDNVERKIDVLGRDMIQLRADQSRVENRLDKLESKPA